MMVPFAVDDFFAVFADYNNGVWPMQLVLAGVAVASIALAWRPRGTSRHLIMHALALLWIWMGAVYHLGYFAAINPAAYLFGLLFVTQGLLFVRAARRHRLSFRATRDRYGWTGALLASYALVLYPLFGLLSGHAYPASPTFGAPCPTVIFTFAILLWSENAVPRHLLVVPLFWSILGGSAVFELGVMEDVGLLVAGPMAAWLILRRNAAIQNELLPRIPVGESPTDPAAACRLTGGQGRSSFAP
jgi:hypothetical protein